jgi:hypothetical protein
MGSKVMVTYDLPKGQTTARRMLKFCKTNLKYSGIQPGEERG